MISEGSCDTEDWSNDAENTALITFKLYLNMYLNSKNISEYCCFYGISDEVNADLWT